MFQGNWWARRLICVCCLLGLPISHLAPGATDLSVAMHTKGEEECGTNVAGENGLAVWMSSGLCIYPRVTLTYTEMVVGDALGFP